MTDAPPGRYKVVERGRRLVVIDTRTGQPATREVKPTPSSRTPMPASAPIENTAPRTIDDRSGAAILRTMPFYDLKGPREIVLTQGFTDRLSRTVAGWMIGFFVFAVLATLLLPWLWLLPVVAAFQPKVHAAFRNWMTARLDEADQAAS
jgi:hypothetical protein